MQNKMNGGLLGSFQPQPQQPQTGGLLGAFAGGAQPAQAGGNGQSQGLQMAQQLAQNPTPEMAQKIIAQLKASDNPEADQLEQILTQVINDPEKIKQVADFVIDHLSKAA